jgi:hypothetical protein
MLRHAAIGAGIGAVSGSFNTGVFCSNMIGDCGVFLREDGGLQMGALDAEQADISDP